MPSVSAAGEQLELEAVVRPRTHGGRRENAGRKRVKGRRGNVPHRKRPLHKDRHPVLVTLRAGRGLPSLRRERIRKLFREVLTRQRHKRYAHAFHVAEFTVQDDHLHLIVEADGPEAHRELRSGVSGLLIAFAKRLNKLLHRRGKVWGDRFHGRELRSPTEVRNALVYVFRNIARHGARMIGDDLVDPVSSGPRFTGWTRPVPILLDDDPYPRLPPKTWLLRSGWSTHGGGPIDPREAVRPGR